MLAWLIYLCDDSLNFAFIYKHFRVFIIRGLASMILKIFQIVDLY